MDDRTFTLSRLFYDLEKVDHLFLGSSRIMQINTDIIGSEIMNLAVTGCSIEDHISLTFESILKLSPKYVYISADPWLFNKNNGQDRYKNIIQTYDYWDKVLLSDGNYSKSYFSTSSSFFSYNNHYLKFIRDFLEVKNIHIPKNSNIESVKKKMYDGSLVYDSHFVSKMNDVRNITDKLDYFVDYGMDNYIFDESKKNKFCKLIDILQKREINVTLILPPFHPLIYDKILLDDSPVLEMENVFLDIARDFDINLLGSYDPYILNCPPDYFFDGMHPTGNAFRLIFDSN